MYGLGLETYSGHLDFTLPSHLAGPLRRDGFSGGLFVLSGVHYRTPARPLGGERPDTKRRHLIFSSRLMDSVVDKASGLIILTM
jgi:hypothetical protein